MQFGHRKAGEQERREGERRGIEKEIKRRKKTKKGMEKEKETSQKNSSSKMAYLAFTEIRSVRSLSDPGLASTGQL